MGGAEGRDRVALFELLGFWIVVVLVDCSLGLERGGMRLAMLFELACLGDLVRVVMRFGVLALVVGMSVQLCQIHQ